MGGGLLALAVPQTTAAWDALPALPVLEKIDNAQTLSIAELRDAIKGLERAVSRVPSAVYLDNLGTVELSLVQTLPFSDPERAGVLATCERHFREGLAASPVDGITWYRLAQARQLGGGDARPVVVALMQSVDMAPNFRPVLVGRTLGLILYRPVLTPEEVQVVESQVRTFWRIAKPADRKMLFDYLRGNDAAAATIEKAVREDPEAQANYEALKAEPKPPAR